MKKIAGIIILISVMVASIGVTVHGLIDSGYPWWYALLIWLGAAVVCGILALGFWLLRDD